MGLARSTYYDEPELQPISEARLVEQIKAVCAEWPAYGYRRVTAELRGEGRLVNHKKVMRLMKENGLTVRPRRRFVATNRRRGRTDRKSTRLNSSHQIISYAVFCLKKKKTTAIE